MEEENFLDEIVGKTIDSIIYDDREDVEKNKVYTKDLIIYFTDGTCIRILATIDNEVMIWKE